MRSKLGSLTAAGGLLMLSANECVASVVYDAITGRTLNSTFVSDPRREHAQEMILTAPGFTLTGVEMVMRNVSAATAYQGQLSVRIYSGAGGLPTTLLATSTLNTFVPAASTVTLTVAFAGTTVSTDRIWLSLVVPENTLGGPSVLGIRESMLPPGLAVGFNRAWNTSRPTDSPDWLNTQPPVAGGSAWAVRIQAIPAPSAAAMVCLAGVFATRRRRLRRSWQPG